MTSLSDSCKGRLFERGGPKLYAIYPHEKSMEIVPRLTDQRAMVVLDKREEFGTIAVIEGIPILGMHKFLYRFNKDSGAQFVPLAVRDDNSCRAVRITRDSLEALIAGATDQVLSKDVLGLMNVKGSVKGSVKGTDKIRYCNVLDAYIRNRSKILSLPGDKTRLELLMLILGELPRMCKGANAPLFRRAAYPQPPTCEMEGITIQERADLRVRGVPRMFGSLLQEDPPRNNFRLVTIDVDQDGTIEFTNLEAPATSWYHLLRSFNIEAGVALSIAESMQGQAFLEVLNGMMPPEQLRARSNLERWLIMSEKLERLVKEARRTCESPRTLLTLDMDARSFDQVTQEVQVTASRHGRWLSCTELASFLRENDVNEEVVQRFIEENINGESAPLLDERDLTALGVTDARRLLKLIHGHGMMKNDCAQN